MIRLGTRTFAVGLAVQLGGCVPERGVEATQIVVSIDSDIEPDVLRTLEVRVSDPSDGRVGGVRSYTLADGAQRDHQVTFPFSFAITRGRSDDVRVVVTGLGAGGADEPSVVHRVDARFIANESLLLRIFLSRGCLGELCDAETTCARPGGEGARCVAVERAPLGSFVPTRENDWPARDAEVALEPQEAAVDAGGGPAAPDDMAPEAPDAASPEEGAAPSDSGAPEASPNMLLNPSFEDTGDDGAPLFWQRIAWRPSPESCPEAVVPQNDAQAVACWMQRTSESASEGAHSVSIAIREIENNDARWEQRVTGLVPGRTYVLCGKVRGSVGPDRPGANLFYDNTDMLSTDVWSRTGEFLAWPAQPYCGTFVASAHDAKVGCRIGFFSGISHGQIWCDEMSLREVTAR